MRDDGNIEYIECGSNREEEGKRIVALLFNREQLLYDIENNCFVEGHILTEADDEVRHTVQDVGQEGNVDRVTRMLDLAHADITEHLYPFTQQDIRHPVVDDRLREKPVYGIFLNVPESFSQTTLNLLGKLIHEYLTSTVTADWMSITNPRKEEGWRAKGAEALRRIYQVKNFRKGRTGRSRIRPKWL